MSIKLSNRTFNILSNFASICPSIVLQPGKKLRVISDSLTTIGMADIEEDFPKEFHILDVTKLLSILKLKNFKECELDFQDSKITLNGDKVNMTFWESAKQLTTPPPQDIELPDISFQAEINSETLNEFIRACSVLGHKTAQFVNKGGKSYLIGTSTEIDNSNDYCVELGETTLGDCSLCLEVSSLKMIDSNYIVKIDAGMSVSSFESSDGSLKYYVGLQQE